MEQDTSSFCDYRYRMDNVFTVCEDADTKCSNKLSDMDMVFCFLFKAVLVPDILDPRI